MTLLCDLAASVIFLNTVLTAVFLLYFIFTPFLMVGITRVSLHIFHLFNLENNKIILDVSKLVYSLLDIRYHHDKPIGLFLYRSCHRMESANVLALLCLLRPETKLVYRRVFALQRMWRRNQ